MSFFKEFKDFAVKGNVMDLAIGVVIGAAFGKIVTSLVNDVIMPLVTLVTGKIDFSNLFIQLDYSDGIIYKTVADAKAKGVPTLNYGTFISNIIDFLIIAFSIFIVIRQINRIKPKCAPAPVTTKECPFCKSTVHIDASRCPNCTSELKQEE